MNTILRCPEDAARQEYDAIIIGGGIYGAMLLLEAAQRGLSVLLLEKNDFGSATSFNNFRIVHGGLRSLQSLDLVRFRESVRERRWFLQTFPDLVRPLSCLMPLYGRGVARPGLFRLALQANDILSLDRNRGVSHNERLGAGRVIGKQATEMLFPGVDRNGLKGGALWYDACMPDCYRILIEVLHWGCELGAQALNYVESKSLLQVEGGAAGVIAEDKLTGQSIEFRARTVINASGPWSRAVATEFDRDVPELFHCSIAWNVLVNRQPRSEHAVAVTPKEPGAQVYFLQPINGKWMIGTGHAPCRVISENPQPTPGQLKTFFAHINRAIPGLDIGLNDVIRMYTGYLPVKRPETAQLSTRAVVFDHGKQGGVTGLYSISGVKFTTARAVAEKVWRYVARTHESVGSHMQPHQGLPRPKPRPYRVSRECMNAKSDWKSDFMALIRDESVLNLEDLVLRRSNLTDQPELAIELLPEITALFDRDRPVSQIEIRALQEKLSKPLG